MTAPLNLTFISSHLSSLAGVARVEVILNPGDVLFVPHRWWHHVVNLDLAVSVNTWIEIPKDAEGRCKEAIVKILVNAIMPSIDDEDDNDEQGDYSVKNATSQNPPWLNPTEIQTSTSQNLHLLNLALAQNQENRNNIDEKNQQSLLDYVNTCKCRQFLPSECGCGSGLRGNVLRPSISKNSDTSNARSQRASKRSKTEIDARILLDALTSDDVVQLLFEKLNC